MPRNSAPSASGRSALYQLRREEIDPYELAFVGDGRPERAPAELVGVLGQSLGRHIVGVNGSAVSPDGTAIATIGGASTIRLWDARTMRQTLVGRMDTGRWWHMCFTNDSTTLAVSGEEREIKFLDVSGTGRQIALVQACDEYAEKIHVRDLRYTQKNRTLSALVRIGDDVRRIRIWNCDERGIPIDHGITVDADEQTVCMAINTEGTILATGARDGKVQLWNLTSEAEMVAEIQSEGSPIRNIAFSADGKQLAAACGHAGVQVWTVTGDKLLPKYVLLGRLTAERGHKTVAFSPDGRYLASGYPEEAIALWNISGTSPVWVSDITTTCPELLGPISFYPDGGTLVSCGNDGLVRLINVTSRPPQPRLVAGGHWSRAAMVEHISRDGTQILTRANDDRLIPWKMVDGRFQEGDAMRLPFQTQFFDVNRATTLMAIANRHSEQIQLFSWQDGQAVLRNRLTSDAPLRALAMSPDGALLVTTSTRGHVFLWDVAENKSTEIGQFPPSAARFDAAAFSPDGRHVAVSSKPQEGKAVVRLWDITQSPPRHLSHLDIPCAAHAETLQFSPNGKLLLQTGKNGIFVTDISGDRPQEAFACKSQTGIGQHGDFSLDGTMLAIHRNKDLLQVRDTKDYSVLHEWTLPAPAHPKFASDSRHLFVGKGNGTVHVIRLSNQ